jgi:hypothetical protein
VAEIPPDIALPAQQPGGGFNLAQTVRSVGLSLFINGICPYILYRALVPHYPPGSLTPLLYASIFPLLGLVFNFIRTRTVDFIALIALFEISFNIISASLAPTIRLALEARSLQGLITATVFIGSALIGRPFFFYVARQFFAAGDPVRAAGFEAANKADGGRTFFLITITWGIGIIVMTAINFTLAMTLAPADYLLVSQILSLAFNISLIAWTIRFSRIRLSRFGPPDARPA